MDLIGVRWTGQWRRARDSNSIQGEGVIANAKMSFLVRLMVPKLASR